MRLFVLLLIILGIGRNLSASENLHELYDSSVNRIANVWQVKGVTLCGTVAPCNGRLINDIHLWGTSINRFDGEKSAVAYLLRIVDDVLHEFNSNQKLRKYFKSYPLKRTDVHVGVAFNRGKMGDMYLPPAFSLVDFCSGNISMYVFENGKNQEVNRFKFE